VDQPATEFGVGVRRLQRLFRDHVGAGPKWVIRRYRLHEAAARAADGPGWTWSAWPPSWATATGHT
jgi:AraC-like DNA-binding protein